MSILSKVSNLKTQSDKPARVEMTAEQVIQCKAALKRDLRGPTVQPNKFDISQPYRVTINFDDKWSNHGLFSSADVAAAVGTIVSASVYGDKAIAGTYDESLVEEHAEFAAWLVDPRNASVLARVENGDSLLAMKQAGEEVESEFTVLGTVLDTAEVTGNGMF